ncbi:MAG: Crp/Fnr family transcriptional regulator [Candidatus Omnitrophota bacterium]|nr:Crp/Fnr family transcriptional regulator [Candidatus Omnitrophota bacterium]
MKKPKPQIGIEDVPLFRGLTKEDLQALKPCLRERSFDKGEVLFHEGAQCERIFIVRSGRVKLYRLAATGREQILETLETGDTCACNPGEKTWSCSSSAEAATPCSVWFLSRFDYLKLVESNSKFTNSLNHLFAEKLRCFSTLIEDFSLKDSRSRLVKFLLDMQAKKSVTASKDGVLYIPFTREEIAQRIGTVRETVARQLHQLKDLNLIDIKPNQIIILDKEGLEALLRQ